MIWDTVLFSSIRNSREEHTLHKESVKGTYIIILYTIYWNLLGTRRKRRDPGTHEGNPGSPAYPRLGDELHV